MSGALSRAKEKMTDFKKGVDKKIENIARYTVHQAYSEYIILRYGTEFIVFGKH